MKKYFAFLAILLILSPAAFADNNYNYLEVKVGHFVDACYRCYTPDGKFPVYVSAGRFYDLSEYFALKFEYQHRSNLDIGWPMKGQSGDSEYHRNGFFASGVLKF